MMVLNNVKIKYENDFSKFSAANFECYFDIYFKTKQQNVIQYIAVYEISKYRYPQLHS